VPSCASPTKVEHIFKKTSVDRIRDVFVRLERVRRSTGCASACIGLSLPKGKFTASREPKHEDNHY
jgi:hypothetical protein